ncbi:hypothetical protein [Nonlabens antarcticus]|uniref:hypothetical protein n=1 Tax=Nonlabens antarcticus TaxID=392714 RepID=UPI001891A7FF|nr:hypothetical protein [Nonlabens antarcticus]
MKYARLKFWFAFRVALFSAIISFPTLARGLLDITIITFATLGIPFGILAYHYFYKQERFVFQNLGIRKRELYVFAVVFIWALTIPLFFLSWMFYG